MLTQLLKTAVKRQVKRSLDFSLKHVNVKVNQGIVRGVIEPLPDGRSFQRFSGIPYAQPPIGKLRFQNPQKLMKFNKDVLDCRHEGHQCYQKSLFWGVHVGSEDCLNMNVYVPADLDHVAKLPVMVYLHGGAFSYGNNKRDLFSPEFLLMNDVIVVVLNFRLHYLGLASIPELGIGNALLKDQQMGLEWVHDNIESFGGDKNNVTLFGESSGAVSAHYQSLNKTSRKFFHKMILQSGNSLVIWGIDSKKNDFTKRMAQLTKGRFGSPQEIYDSLMKVDAKDLFALRWKARSDYHKYINQPTCVTPIIEEESDESFITKFPTDIIKEEGSEMSMPIMSGFNNADGLYQMGYYTNKIARTDKQMNQISLSLVDVNIQSSEGLNASEEMRQFYFGEQGLTEESLPQFSNLCTDIHFSVPTVMFNEMYRKFSPNSKQFTYEFCIESKLNLLKAATKLRKLPGVFHSDELSYLFDYKMLDNAYPEDSQEWKYREMMCKMWTNFAKYSDPTPDHDNSLVKWNPIENGQENSPINYLKITNDGNIMNQDVYKDRMNFWKGQFEKFNGSFLNPRSAYFGKDLKF